MGATIWNQRFDLSSFTFHFPTICLYTTSYNILLSFVGNIFLLLMETYNLIVLIWVGQQLKCYESLMCDLLINYMEEKS